MTQESIIPDNCTVLAAVPVTYSLTSLDYQAPLSGRNTPALRAASP